MAAARSGCIILTDQKCTAVHKRGVIELALSGV